MFDVFLPVANMSVSLPLILGCGGVVGFLSGLFGVGGGFLLTPLLMMIGIPPAVAAASDSCQIVAAASSGALAHKRMGNVDVKMGIVLLAGGIAGGTVGVQLVKLLREMGNFEFAIKAIYVCMLGLVGGAMFIESLNTLRKSKDAGVSAPPGPSKMSQLFSRLPFQQSFPKAGIKTSMLFPFVAGAVVGTLAALMGVGGGFIMVPTMIYIIGMPTVVAIGTDLFQIVFTTANVTLMQAIVNHTVDIELSLILLAGSTIGAQFGAKLTKRLRGEQLRILLAVIVLGLMFKLLIDLLSTPNDLVGLLTASGGH
ncbi:MAG: sulfite exporter TauE/SafE family protein [Pseudomonadota bacterium]